MCGRYTLRVTAADFSDDSIIAEGGAAATAYARLQFEQMDEDTRARILAALLCPSLTLPRHNFGCHPVTVRVSGHKVAKVLDTWIVAFRSP
jgi:hypothetical protein